MPTRLRFYDCRNSDLPSAIGLCQSDNRSVANAVNSAQRRLLFCKEAGDEGWWGSWAEILFYVSRSAPYITLPREVARLESINVCNTPAPVNNQFFEFLRFGNGRMPKCQSSGCGIQAAYSRNNAVTFTDLSNAPQFITAIASSSQDFGKRVFIAGLDQNGNAVNSQAGLVQVQGLFMNLDAPFVTTSIPFNFLTGIQKDQTAGQVSFYQTDPTTGDQILLLTMEPSETTASYRRYFLHNLPANCCPNPSNLTSNIPVTAIAKLELVPVQVDTDYCLIQNLEAISLEAQSIRLSRVDNEASKKMSAYLHNQAVKMLNGELVHYMGAKAAAINFAPFGSARLENQRIGNLI